MKRKIHLTEAQRAAILTLISNYNERPTIKQYARDLKALRALPVEKKPRARRIANTSLGFNPGEVKLCAAFDAVRDLPAGWAVFSCYDSGGNHGIGNAAACVWSCVWNYWSNGKPFDLKTYAFAPTDCGNTISSLIS